jgi:hypothetical protein
LPFGKIHKNVYISAKSLKLKDFLHIRLKPKNTRVACHETPEMNEARVSRRTWLFLVFHKDTSLKESR